MELTCVCARMRQVSRVVTQHYDAALAGCGLTSMQFTILMTVREMRAARVTQIAKVLMLDQTTATRSLKLLQQRGWLKENASEDRRAKVLKLTKAGAAVLGTAEPLWAAVQDSMVQKIGSRDWELTQRTLSGIVAASIEDQELHSEP